MLGRVIYLSSDIYYDYKKFIFGPTIPFLGLYTTGLLAYIQNVMCTVFLTEVVVIFKKIRNNPNALLWGNSQIKCYILVKYNTDVKKNGRDLFYKYGNIANLRKRREEREFFGEWIKIGHMEIENNKIYLCVSFSNV